MKNDDENPRPPPHEETLFADQMKDAVTHNAEQIAAQKLIVAAAGTEWELVLAQCKLRQLEIDGNILRGEMSIDDPFSFGRELARHVTRIEWDIEALSKVKLK